MPLPDLRLDVILAELDRHDHVFVKDIAEQLKVSRETIRRDLKELELAGKLRCTYGGAIRAADWRGPADLAAHARQRSREGGDCGPRRAARARRHHIFIDAGTTTLAFARHLVDRDRLRVFTNSLDIAQLLAGGSLAEVTVVGGRLRPDYRALLGPLTLEAAAQHVFDVAFISVAAVDASHGFMDFGQDEALAAPPPRAPRREVVVLADSAKFGRLAAVRTLEFRQVHSLVTDTQPPRLSVAKLEEAGVETICA